MLLCGLPASDCFYSHHRQVAPRPCRRAHGQTSVHHHEHFTLPTASTWPYHPTVPRNCTLDMSLPPPFFHPAGRSQTTYAGLDVAGRFNSHRRAAQRLTLHCGTGVLGCHREASSAGALQSDPFSSRAARKISLERKSHTSRLQTMVGYVATARNSVPASILYLLLSKNSLRFARSFHPTEAFVFRRLIRPEKSRWV